MKRTSLLVAMSVAATAVAAPVALAHNDAPARGGDTPAAKAGKKNDRGTAGARAATRTHYVLRACVAADATATGVDTKVLWGNRAARRALAGATTFSVTLGEKTAIRLVGKAARAKAKAADGKRHRHRHHHPRRAVAGTHADLKVGDTVLIHIRAPRGTAAADLPAARRVIDSGPRTRCTAEPAGPEQPASTVPAGFTPA